MLILKNKKERKPASQAFFAWHLFYPFNFPTSYVKCSSFNYCLNLVWQSLSFHWSTYSIYTQYNSQYIWIYFYHLMLVALDLYSFFPWFVCLGIFFKNNFIYSSSPSLNYNLYWGGVLWNLQYTSYQRLKLILCTLAAQSRGPHTFLVYVLLCILMCVCVCV